MSEDEELVEMLSDWLSQIEEWDAGRERGHELRTPEISELMMMASNAAEIAIVRIAGLRPAKPTTGE